jgi:hypothetical protein
VSSRAIQRRRRCQLQQLQRRLRMPARLHLTDSGGCHVSCGHLQHRWRCELQQL